MKKKARITEIVSNLNEQAAQVLTKSKLILIQIF